MTPAWADHVDKSLADLWEQNDKQDKRLTEGNLVMNEINGKVTALTERATPVIEAMEGMQRGIHVIGAIGAFVGRAADFLWRWARRGVKVGLTVVACWLFYKAVLSGHSWSDALEIATKALR
jgi:hypothetical protein